MICRRTPVGLTTASAWPAGLRGGCCADGATYTRVDKSAASVDFTIASPLSFSNLTKTRIVCPHLIFLSGSSGGPPDDTHYTSVHRASCPELGRAAVFRDAIHSIVRVRCVIGR